jgi:hypothetical protein
MNKVIEVDPNAREVKKEVLTTFKIKEEVKKSSYYICSQKGGKRVGANKAKSEWHTKANTKVQCKYSNYLYYHWIQQSTFLKVPSYVLVVAWVVDFLLFHHSDLEIHSHSMHIHNRCHIRLKKNY